MSQESVQEWMKINARRRVNAISAKELQVYLDLQKSIYPNLQKLSADHSTGIQSTVRVSADSKRKKEFIYWFEPGVELNE